MNTTEPAAGGTVSQWLVEAHLAPGVQANVERLARSEDVRHVVVLPDVHLGRLINNVVIETANSRTRTRTRTTRIRSRLCRAVPRPSEA